MVTRLLFVFSPVVLSVAFLAAPTVVPNEIQQPGTQPGETLLEGLTKCSGCHGGYDPAAEPLHNWSGGMMAQAGRDPLFWATLAIAEQDFAGSGDLCLRCHAPEGWIGGRSTPTDGSGLAASDGEGVICDLCHKMANPDDSEHLGVQNAPFLAHDGLTASTAYLGSGMFVLSDAAPKLGPYSETVARHQFNQSLFHRSRDFCGTCHDVSNPAVGDLAHNAGAQNTADPVARSGVLGDSLENKAAFRNFVYQYGVVERTFSEYKAGALSDTLVSDYATLPIELQAGAIAAAHQAAQAAGQGGDYADGAPRYFSCQSCHVPPVIGEGCDKNDAPLRYDLPRHDMTGGNYWAPDAILYLDALDKLRLGGGLSTAQITAISDGKTRAMAQLNRAAQLVATETGVRVVNLTGHKLISGYPEGRRMWLNAKWYDDEDVLLREDGAYGPLTVQLDGQAVVVESLLDPHDEHTRVYEADYGMTQEWAAQLLSLGYSADLSLHYDRVSGAVDLTLGELAALSAGEARHTFHFVLNNTVVHDNRIPPYGMRYDDARVRNTLPVPADQFGDPGPGGAYDCWDDVALDAPDDAVRADVILLYQPTSWEYIQFLYLANTGAEAFLADEGANLLDAWLNTGMATPHVMAAVSWMVPEEQYAIADMNCDGVVNAFDIDPFVLALVNPAAYAQQYEGCDASLADANGDGQVNAFDIDPFVVLLVTGG